MRCLAERERTRGGAGHGGAGGVRRILRLVRAAVGDPRRDEDDVALGDARAAPGQRRKLRAVERKL
jgi:hypothetical protein